MKRVAGAKVVLNIGGPLIDVDRGACRTHKPRRTRRINQIRVRKESQQPGNDRIVNRSTLRVAQHYAVKVQSLSLAQTFVRKEKEELLFNNRPTNVAAKLITNELCWFGRPELEKVTGIQRTVAEKLEQLSMKLVGARLCRNVDDGAPAFAVLSGKR